MNHWSEGTVAGAGVPIHFHRTGGDKPPVVLAHGFSDNGLCWTRFAHALEDDFDLVMVDARNHGESGTAAGGFAELAEDLAAVITGLGLDRPSLVGHSVGARTVADMVGLHPELASRVVLEDPPWTSSLPAADDEQAARRRRGFERFLESLATMTPEEIAAAGRETNPTWHADEFPAWAASKQQVRLVAAEGLATADWRQSVRNVRCPALLVHGDTERGGIVSLEVAAEVRSLNERFETREIAGAGHNVRREGFDGYVEVVAAFLAAG